MSRFKLTPALAFLIIANLVPIFGVLQLGWKVGDILILYWMENLVIGALNIPKMLACKGFILGKLFLIAFFTAHFGLFCFAHGAIIADIFGDGKDLKSWVMQGPLQWAALSLFVSHSFSMMVNFFGKQEYVERDANTQMFLPYGRIVVMHVVVLVGGLLVQSLGSPIYALFVLIGLKIIMDSAAHSLEHRDKMVEMKD